MPSRGPAIVVLGVKFRRTSREVVSLRQHAEAQHDEATSNEADEVIGIVIQNRPDDLPRLVILAIIGKCGGELVITGQDRSSSTPCHPCPSCISSAGIAR